MITSPERTSIQLPDRESRLTAMTNARSAASQPTTTRVLEDECLALVLAVERDSVAVLIEE
jgi:hypothetical protein